MKKEKKNFKSIVFNKLEIVSLILDFLDIDEEYFFANKDCYLEYTSNGKIKFSYWDIIESEDEP